MTEEVVIERRFRGPRESGNGGYSCGLVAAFIEPDPAAEVTLRAPPPLDRALGISHGEGATRLHDGDLLVAEGRPGAAPELELPSPVSLEDAAAAREASPLQHSHAFPECFVCGPDRRYPDGLGVVCGPVPGREQELLAAPFETDDSMAGETGAVRDELVWSVLDCPSGLAGMLVPGLGTAVLARLTAHLIRPLEAGQAYVAIGWPIGREGRKMEGATAILDRRGDPLAVSRALWIELRDQPAADG